jgi:WD40 repeat protein
MEQVRPQIRNHYLTGVAFSPDSRRVAAPGSDGTVRVWELPADEQVLSLQATTASLSGLAFNPTGDRLVTAGADRVVRVWDTTTGKEANSLVGHDRPIRAVAFCSDGRRVASVGGEVRIWDAEAGQRSRIASTPQSPSVGRSVSSPDGRLIARIETNSLVIRDSMTGKERMFAPAPGIDEGERFSSVVFTPDSTAIVTTGTRGIALWDMATGSQRRLFSTQPKDGNSLVNVEIVFGPDGRRIAAVGQYLLMVWDSATAQPIINARLHSRFAVWVGGVVFSPDGRRIAVATKAQPKQNVPLPAEIKLWDIESGRELPPISGGGGGVAYSPDGTRLVSGNADGTVSVWDVESEAIVLILRGHADDVTDVAYSRDGRRLVTCSADKTIRLWDPAVGKELLILRGHEGKVIRARLSPDGLSLTSTALGVGDRVRVWDARPVAP